MTPSERYTEREDTAHLYEQRLDRESRFREPSEAEIDEELKRRREGMTNEELRVRYE